MEATAFTDTVGTSLRDTTTVRRPVSAAKEEELLRRYKQSALEVLGLASARTSSASAKTPTH